MKKIVIILTVLVATAIFAPGAGAEEFFRPDEKQAICAVVAEVLPGCTAEFADIGTGTGILVGPPQFNLLYFYVKRNGELIVEKPPVGYKVVLEKIGWAIYGVMESWPAQRALGPGPKELRGEAR